MSGQQDAPATATPILVFAKAPVAGFAKTRLIPRLGAGGAAALAARLLQHAVGEAVAAKLGPVELWAAPDISHASIQALSKPGVVELREQGSGDLGDRMARAFASAFANRAEAAVGGVLLIGTDAPGLDRNYLRQAASALQSHDAVFGPALDGGYTLVGLRRPVPVLFEAMTWSTAQVMAETRSRLQALGLHHAELPPLSDIDEPADLNHLPAHWLEAAAKENQAAPQNRVDTRSPADPD